MRSLFFYSFDVSFDCSDYTVTVWSKILYTERKYKVIEGKVYEKDFHSMVSCFSGNHADVYVHQKEVEGVIKVYSPTAAYQQ